MQLCRPLCKTDCSSASLELSKFRECFPSWTKVEEPIWTTVRRETTFRKWNVTVSRDDDLIKSRVIPERILDGVTSPLNETKGKRSLFARLDTFVNWHRTFLSSESRISWLVLQHYSLTDRDSSVNVVTRLLAARSLYLHSHIRQHLIVLINNSPIFYTIMLPAVGLGEHGAGISFMIHVVHEMLLREPHIRHFGIIYRSLSWICILGYECMAHSFFNILADLNNRKHTLKRGVSPSLAVVKETQFDRVYLDRESYFGMNYETAFRGLWSKEFELISLKLLLQCLLKIQQKII